MKALLERVGDSKVQVVMSDMAPNMSEHGGGYPPRHVSGGAGVRDVPRLCWRQAEVL
ncbi:cell division protein [Salmonella enterica subsp. enterica]|uniref:Cell division protein n=1 Tax=Salmonella enterica I TaxID=59201 RepID=A0A3S4F251_SALET|nr:cell division protein [Salmonella enterica subsp. enterica]